MQNMRRLISLLTAHLVAMIDYLLGKQMQEANWLSDIHLSKYVPGYLN